MSHTRAAFVVGVERERVADMVVVRLVTAGLLLRARKGNGIHWAHRTVKARSGGQPFSLDRLISSGFAGPWPDLSKGLYEDGCPPSGPVPAGAPVAVAPLRDRRPPSAPGALHARPSAAEKLSHHQHSYSE